MFFRLVQGTGRLLGVQMANTGGTILSGASGEISLRHRRTRALLLSTALVPALAVGALLVPTAAEAACTPTGLLTTSVTYNCTDTTNASATGLLGGLAQDITVNATGRNLTSTGSNDGLFANSIGGTYDPPGPTPPISGGGQDRKSTRLNSSH